ncbi:MAG: hypothetical protein ACYDEY_11190 [Acidimicrobiales bacterium]
MEVLDHKHSFAKFLTAVFIGAPMLVSASCGLVGGTSTCGRDAGGMPTCPVSLKFIESQPEAHLLYPGSTTIGGQSGGGENHDIFTTNPALLHAWVVAKAPMATVYAWYRTWLTHRGWHPSQVLALGPLGISSQGYAKGTRESFVVQADSQELARINRSPIPPRLQTETLYSTTFIIEPYKN